jgi:hypothetical protein
VIQKHRGRRLGVALALLVPSLALPANASAHRCGRLPVPARGLDAKVRIVHGPISCHSARKLIVTAYHAESTRHSAGFQNPDGVFWRVDGWRCYIGLAGSQTFCHRGIKRVDGSLRTDDGWTF